MSGRDIKTAYLGSPAQGKLRGSIQCAWENFQYALEHHEKEKNEPKDMFA
jgi:AAA family ATPase